MAQPVEKVIIIGSGPAGLTAAIYASRANLDPVIIEGSEPGGQLMGTTYVENWPGNKSILGPKLMMAMRDHAKEFGTRFISQNVTNIESKKRPYTITTDKGDTYQAHAIIVATGATPKRLKVPGEDTYWGKGVTTCAVCDGAFYKDRPVIIIGGGDTAMEDASFMTKFTEQITIVQIEDKLTASAAMQERVLDNPKINIIYNATVTEFHGDGEKLSGVTVTHQKDQTTEQLKVDAAFLAIGLRPNTGFLKGHIELNDLGYVVLRDHVTTSVEGIFAAGDVADWRYRQAITSAGSGCMAALEAGWYLQRTLKE